MQLFGRLANILPEDQEKSGRCFPDCSTCSYCPIFRNPYNCLFRRNSYFYRPIPRFTNFLDMEFSRGTPSSYRSNPPAITYSAAGIYDVTLTVSDGSATDSETKTGYITVKNVIADFTGTPTKWLLEILLHLQIIPVARPDGTGHFREELHQRYSEASSNYLFYIRNL